MWIFFIMLLVIRPQGGLRLIGITSNVVFNRYENANIMFLAWFEANKIYTKGKDLTSSEFPSKFVWFAKEKEWKPRNKGYNIGRLTYIPPGSRHLYYLRILLVIQKCCIDYESRKTIDGKLKPTKKLAMLWDCWLMTKNILMQSKKQVNSLLAINLEDYLLLYCP